MNTRTSLFALACAIALCPALQSQTINSQSGAKKGSSSAKTEKRTVKQLDGTKQFGFVEITDDYTIRVSNDSGIIRLPIAELGDADFRKYGFKKDRSKDGRFWYEWKEALKELKEVRNLRTRQNPVKSPLWKSGWPKSQHFNLSSRPMKRRFLPRKAQISPGIAVKVPMYPSGPCFPSRPWEIHFPKLYLTQDIQGSNRSQMQLNCRRRHDCEFLARKPDQGTRRLYSTSRADKSSPCWLCRDQYRRRSRSNRLIRNLWLNLRMTRRTRAI